MQCTGNALKAGLQNGLYRKGWEGFFAGTVKKAIVEVGINADSLYMDEEVHTTLALVHTYPDGDRDFSFYRNPGADMMLREEELNEDLLKNTRIFHFGTLSMTDAGVRNATKEAIAIAKAGGAVISFDPNLRPPLWKSLETRRNRPPMDFPCVMC